MGSHLLMSSASFLSYEECWMVFCAACEARGILAISAVNGTFGKVPYFCKITCPYLSFLWQQSRASDWSLLGRCDGPPMGRGRGFHRLHRLDRFVKFCRRLLWYQSMSHSWRNGDSWVCLRIYSWNFLPSDMRFIKKDFKSNSSIGLFF